MATRLSSIQGEQERTTGVHRASQADVDNYVDNASEEVLACRQRGRHLYPPMNLTTGIDFDDVDDNGLFVRRATCTCCGLVARVERWEATGRGNNVRFLLVHAAPEYLQGPNGETYLAPPGHGTMPPSQIASSIASKAMKGRSIPELRKALRKNRTAGR